MKLCKICKGLRNPKELLLYVVQTSHIADKLDDERYLKLICRLRFGKHFDLSSPKTFSEKINWLKLHNRKAIYTTMVDKYSAKQYVASIIGEKYVIPTLGVWDRPEDINWDELPNKFVLKTTHGGGSTGVVVCKDKKTFDIKSASQRLNRSLRGDIYSAFREWPYKNVRKRIIAEKFMSSCSSDCSSDLTDYKFFCFNGKPVYCQVIRNRHTKETIDFYDMEWNHQNFVGLNPTVRNGDEPTVRPRCLEEMIEISKKLSSGIPFLRVDLYDIDGNVFFGEMTFFPASGMGVFTPLKWNKTLGDLITI